MESSGIGKSELSKLSGIHIKSIENYFREKPVIPKVDNAVKLAQVLGVTVEYLVSGNEKKKKENINIHNKNRDFFITLAKLDKYNFEVVASIAKTLLHLQSKKHLD